MNFLTVERGGNLLEHDVFSYQISSETVNVINDASDRLTLGVRPEHIAIVDSDVENAIRTEVMVVEPMGELSYVYFTVDSETYTVSVNGEMDVSAGDAIYVRFPEEKIHLFDDETGEAVKNSETTENVEPTTQT